MIIVVAGGETKRADDFVCSSPRGSYTPLRWALFSVFSFVYLHEFVGRDVGLVDPLIVSGRVVLPSYEILQFLSSAEVALSEDLFDFPFFLPFDQFGRWFEEVCSVFFGLLVWRKEGCVKHIVDSPCFREPDLVGDVGDLCDYLERSVSLWGQFPTIVRSFDVCSFQPYFISNFEAFELCFLDHLFLGLFQRVLGLFPCFFDAC